MQSPWRVQKSYKAAGIEWEVGLPELGLQWNTKTDWGDEAGIEEELIHQFAIRLLGPFTDEDIRIDHLCIDNKKDRIFRLRYLPNGAEIQTTERVTTRTKLCLFAEAIRVNATNSEM